MKTLKLSIPVTEDEKVSGMVAVPDNFQKVLGRFKTDWDLEVIDGGDHSFYLPKSVAIPPKQVYVRITQKTVKWLKTHL